MTQLQLLTDIVDIVIQVAFWLTLVFPFALLFFWDWRKELFGKALVVLDYLVGLALLPAIVRRYFGVDPSALWFGWFEAAVIALIPVRALVLGWAIYRVQQRRPRKPPSAAVAEPTELPEPEEITEQPAGQE